MKPPSGPKKQTQFKPNTNPIAERVKLMQSVYLQRIMKKNADRGYEKTNPKQTQFQTQQPRAISCHSGRNISADFANNANCPNPARPDCVACSCL